MNYKKLIPNQETRLKIIGIFDFLPDKLMVKIQYRIKMGRKLELENPSRYTEKIQWYKLYYHNPLMTQCVDKYSVREYLHLKKLDEILVPLYGVYDDANDIDFDKLPSSFVLKTTNGSHTNILCENKAELNVGKIKKILNKWLIDRTSKAGREWPYYNVNPKIVCEEFLKSNYGKSLVDYKFLCFNGKVEYIFVNMDRTSDEKMKFGIYDENFVHLSVTRKGLLDTDDFLEKPKNFKRMKEVAEILSKDFPHVRVDLYNINGKIHFGEMTFFHGSGYIEFNPDEFDYLLGDLFELPKRI